MRSSTVLMFIVVVPYFLGQTTGYTINLHEASKDIEALRNYYKTMDLDDKADEKVDGNLFVTLFELWKGDEAKKLVLSQIVPMYMKMLDSIKTAELQNSIKNLKHILDVSNEEILTQSSQKLKHLNEISSIKMTDTQIQHRAIKELYPVLQAISCLEKDCTTKKRKREFARKRRARQN